MEDLAVQQNNLHAAEMAIVKKELAKSKRQAEGQSTAERKKMAGDMAAIRTELTEESSRVTRLCGANEQLTAELQKERERAEAMENDLDTIWQVTDRLAKKHMKKERE